MLIGVKLAGLLYRPPETSPLSLICVKQTFMFEEEQAAEPNKTEEKASD